MGVIKIKRSSTASAVPTSGQLSAGELALNNRDLKLFFLDHLGAVKTVDLAPRSKRVVDFGGRFYMNPDGRWVYNTTNYGVATDNHYSGGGTSTEPSYDWQAIGVYMRKGDTLESFIASMRSASSLLTGFNWRLHFVYATNQAQYVEDPVSTWNTEAETTFDEIYSEDGLSLGTYWSRKELTGLDYTAPEDGHLIMAVQPIGTFESIIYMHFSGIYEILNKL